MTELLLICAIGALGVAFATTVARWVAQRPIADDELLRASEAVNGGVVRYLRRQNVVAASVAAVVGAAVFLAYGVAYQMDGLTAVSPREHGVWLTVSYILGAAFGVVTASVAAWMFRQASARVAAGARRSLDESLQIAVRAGAVSGVIALALALTGLAGLFLAFYIYSGGLDDPGLALVRAPEVPLLLTGFCLGAAFVALLSQIGGGIFGNVADIGADVAGKIEASLSEDSPDNPAVIADLVGDNVGDGAARAVGVFAAASVESVAAMLVAAALYRDNAGLTSVTAVVLFPLVARTFSLVAVLFGVMVVRTDDTEVPMNAVGRGLHVTTLLYAVGAVGCAKWLLGEYWMRFGACAILGSAAGLVCLYATQYYSEQKYRPVRMLAEAARGGSTLATLRGIVTATEGALVQVAILITSMLGAFWVGGQTGLVGGGLFGVAVCVGGMLGSAPYVLAMDGLGSIADTAGGIIEMTVAAERPDVRARARLLDAVGTTTKSYTRILVALTSSMSCFLLLAVFLNRVWNSVSTTRAGFVDVTSPMLYAGAVLGAVVVLVFMWVTLRRITNSSRELVNELRVQLGADERGAHVEARLRPMSDLGADAGGQLACVEIVSRVALRGMIMPAIVGVGLPLLIGVALRLISSGDRVTTSAEALVALLVVATIAGAIGSLLFTNAGSAWDNAKKYIETGAHGGRYLVDSARAADDGVAPALQDPRSGGGAHGSSARHGGDDAASSSHAASRRDAGGGDVDNPTYLAAVVGDTVGDSLKGAIGPAAPSLVLTLAALALVFLPFFL